MTPQDRSQDPSSSPSPPSLPEPPERSEVVRSEEELHVDRVAREAGAVRAKKTVEHERVEEVVGRGVEHADVERTGPMETDSGEVETLPDGSVSIPVFEEQIVVSKRLVVRERVVIRKRTITEEHVVEADLRREHVEVDVDPEIADAVTVEDSGTTR